MLFFALVVVSLCQDGFYRYFGDNNEHCRNIAVGDDGFVVTGKTKSWETHSDGWDLLWAKFSHDGDALWIRQFGTSGVDSSQEIIYADGDYVVCAKNDDTSIFVKINSDTGAISWESLMSTSEFFFKSVSERSSNGDLFAVGDFDDSGDECVGVIHLNSSGNVEDAKAIDAREDYGNTIQVVSDGIIILGTTNVDDTSSSDLFVAKLGYDLTVDHFISVGESVVDEEGYGFSVIDDNEVAIVGWDEDWCIRFFVVEISASPVLSVKRQICHNDYDFEMYGIGILPGRTGYLLIGSSYSSTTGFWNGTIVNVTNQGEVEYIRLLVGASELTSIEISEEYGIYLSGNRHDKNCAVMRLNEDGTVCGGSTDLSSSGIQESTITDAEAQVSSYTLNSDPNPDDGTLGLNTNGAEPTLPSESTLFYCYECFGTLYNDEEVCSGHGECKEPNNCTCEEGYGGEQECHSWSCWGIPATDVGEVCGGNNGGVCMDENECYCFSGFTSLEIFGECTEWKCGTIDRRDMDIVCSGRGECTSPQVCDCGGGYEGDVCETYSCGYDYKLEELTCSGHGKCVAPGECQCSTGFVGDLCEENTLYYYVLVPVVSVFGVSALIIIMFVLCLCCCTLCCCICAVYLGSVIVVCLSGIVGLQKLRMRKFDKLKDINIFIREQELEDVASESVAEIKIDRNLFEIPYGDIQLKEIIGEGGSYSTVYRAEWKKRIVAFKSFKTRQVCDTQDHFDQFEAEVRIHSSISHPNIIRFYGGSLKHPRVGIVMEYCEHGDCIHFLKKYSYKNDGEFYPIDEKIRMIHEIACGMEYLHSKKILHRDLKLENVLIDRNETAKLIDFGLSRIVDVMSAEKTKQIGTSYYMSPEMTLGQKYTVKTDVYSFGILCYIMLTQMKNPFELLDGGAAVQFQVASDPDFRPDLKELEKVTRDKKDDWIRLMIVSCWHHEPSIRKEFSEILEIIEERTVVEEAVVEYTDEMRSTGSLRFDKRSKPQASMRKKTLLKAQGGSSSSPSEMDNLREKVQSLEDENKEVNSKLQLLRRRLFTVQKERERVTRILSTSKIDFNNSPAPPPRRSRSRDNLKQMSSPSSQEEDSDNRQREETSEDEDRTYSNEHLLRHPSHKRKPPGVPRNRPPPRPKGGRKRPPPLPRKKIIFKDRN